MPSPAAVSRSVPAQATILEREAGGPGARVDAIVEALAISVRSVHVELPHNGIDPARVARHRKRVAVDLTQEGAWTTWARSTIQRQCPDGGY
eukprot:scaffold73185_cov31-Tisochrysis_lutea.AAC.7